MSGGERILIHGGHVVDPANGVDGPAEISIAAGRILAVGAVPEGFTAEREIDAGGQLVCPGLVDLAARLREPGQEHKASIASETRAAAAGGITTLCCLPDTEPMIDTPAVAELIRQRAEAAGQARVVSLGALTQGLRGEHLSEMAALKAAGCRGVSNAGRPLANSLVQRRAFEYAASFDLTVFIHAEDHWLAAGGCAHEGAVATRLGLPGIPAAAETAAVARDLALIEQTGVRAHFCRISTARAAQMIARAQYDGLPISADVAIPYLFLSEVDLTGFDSQCHLRPPLRTLRDRDGLRAALARGTLSALCSDHQPHEADAKLAPFPATEPGISGLDTLLSLGLRLIEEGLLSLPELIERLSLGPARVLDLTADGSGSLTPGGNADLIVIDPEAHWRVGPDTLRSQGHNTPFLGWELKGRVTHTLIGGRQVFQRQP
ncbi:dihydroorotase [Thiohalobacter sp. IOR34]|uniref:dihydroorotase n=1 Tax=Thiohalobacter sp. IOR34 TaxID=3057176 RepID=UPI0025B127AC|nr:dihydroorotase [Thiohalobacter sp. IOR34]WJW75781.1 dihydroorotase [Thiohalobacter sp. IOR34]